MSSNCAKMLFLLFLNFLTQINGGITVNVDVSVKKHNVCEKGYI